MNNFIKNFICNVSLEIQKKKNNCIYNYLNFFPFPTLDFPLGALPP